MLTGHRVYGGVGGHGVAIMSVVVRRKRWDGWGVCDGDGSLAFTTALIAWVSVSFAVSGQAMVLACSLCA